MGTYFLLDSLTHAKQAEQVYGNWIDLFKLIFSKHIPACKWFLHYFTEKNYAKVILVWGISGVIVIFI